MTRLVASPSSTGERLVPWKYGSVLPTAKFWPATTSMARPFSACIMISPPFFLVCCIAWKIAPSSLKKTPG